MSTQSLRNRPLRSLDSGGMAWHAHVPLPPTLLRFHTSRTSSEVPLFKVLTSERSRKQADVGSKGEGDKTVLEKDKGDSERGAERNGLDGECRDRVAGESNTYAKAKVICGTKSLGTSAANIALTPLSTPCRNGICGIDPTT